MDWDITPVRAPLTYLRVTLHSVYDLLAILATRPLFKTLRQLHVTLRDNGIDRCLQVSDMKLVFCMSSLRTFTFVKALYRQFADEWPLIDILTSATVLPVLQRANLVVAIDALDLDRIHRSALFTDHRRVDVQFAFILNDNSSHTAFDRRVPRGSRSHSRSIASATFVRNPLINNRPYALPSKYYVSFSFARSFAQVLSSHTSYQRSHLCLFQGCDLVDRSHLWYTLPWAFNEFVQISIPDKKISHLEVWQSSQSSRTVSSSRLVRMDLIWNEVSPILTQSPIMSAKSIEELYLFCCNRDVVLKQPSLGHLTVISSLDTLHRCSSISMNIQSIIIVLDQWYVPYATGGWTALRSLRSLPHLRSLRVLLYDLHMSADDPSCAIIAATAVRFVDFAFSFRRCGDFHDLDDESAFKRCCSFIEELRRRILALSSGQTPQCSVEKDGCGLIVWRQQRYQEPIRTLLSSQKQTPCTFRRCVWTNHSLVLNKNDCPWCWIKEGHSPSFPLDNPKNTKITWNRTENITSSCWSASACMKSIKKTHSAYSVRILEHIDEKLFSDYHRTRPSTFMVTVENLRDYTERLHSATDR